MNELFLDIISYILVGLTLAHIGVFFFWKKDWYLLDKGDLFRFTILLWPLAILWYFFALVDQYVEKYIKKISP